MDLIKTGYSFSADEVKFGTKEYDAIRR